VKRCLGAALAAVLLSIAAGPAAAAVREGSGADPSGDGTAGLARDVTAVHASYDDATGAIAFRVTFASAPSAGDTSLVAAAVGTRQPNGSCTTPWGIVGASVSGASATWLRNDGSATVASGAASASVAGAR
jgi:hypothetical protein